MLYNDAGFALALAPRVEEIPRPSWMHFGIALPDRDAVLELRDRLARDGVELVEQWANPNTSASSAVIPTATSSKRGGNRSSERSGVKAKRRRQRAR
jgi:hypothetical protein